MAVQGPYRPEQTRSPNSGASGLGLPGVQRHRCGSSAVTRGGDEGGELLGDAEGVGELEAVGESEAVGDAKCAVAAVAQLARFEARRGG